MIDKSKTAFPVTPTDRSGQCAPTQWGMTLREHYAGLAMLGLLANPVLTDDMSPEKKTDTADAALELADLLIAALQEATDE